jgi:hypothetical protein
MQLLRADPTNGGWTLDMRLVCQAAITDVFHVIEVTVVTG